MREKMRACLLVVWEVLNRYVIGLVFGIIKKPLNQDYSSSTQVFHLRSNFSGRVMDSFGDRAFRFDVFLSFCGEDTRHKFTDHLYEKLIHAGISTFRDNEGIEKGEKLQSEFKKAIKESRASIVVLSENYATSGWCLDELLLILEQRREYNQFVLPVFYHVQPTDIRKKRGKFDIKVKLSSKWTDDNINKWETALMEVADLAGHVVVSG